MSRSYSDYINIIDEVEKVEQVVTTDTRCKKVCYFVLEIIKLGTQYPKNTTVNVTINASKEEARETKRY